MNFHDLKVLIEKQMNLMTSVDGVALFQSKASKDVLWDTYLGSFPEGTNPIEVKRTTHDCNCCKNFIRAAGGIVAYIDGTLVSIWDIKIDNEYQVVVDALSKLVKEAGIETIYLHDQSHVGQDKTNSIGSEGHIVTYEHFHYVLPKSVVYKQGCAKRRGEARSNYESLRLAMTQISKDDADIIADLIHQKAIEGWSENKRTVLTIQSLLGEYAAAPDIEQFLWTTSAKLGKASTLRNGPIGTLMTNMSKGDSLEVAIHKYEVMVSGPNFKRKKTLATPKMIEAASVRIEELGLSDSLHRRHSRMDDLTINNVLFADTTAKASMGVFDLLKGAGKVETPNLDAVEEVSIAHFMENILPRAESLELMVENSHVNNLMSLISPTYANSGNLFKWDNNFSWAYNGDVTNSLREQVKSAGGRVDGAFRFSHSWNHDGQNQSLMDLHVFMPGNSKVNGVNDSYGSGRRVGWNVRQDRMSGGIQDVDFTTRAGSSVPVENITFPSLDTMPDGVYTCAIHNWEFRGPTTSGFHAEIEFAGEVHTYQYPKALKGKEWIVVAKVTKLAGKFTIEHMLPSTATTQEVWGINTHKFVKVDTVMLSPNFWDGQEIGKKHYFFILDDCKNPDDTRGFYTEFMRDELHEDRKVFEMLGSKLKVEHSPHQLSGLGFAYDRRNSVVCKVRGSFNRTIKVNF